MRSAIESNLKDKLILLGVGQVALHVAALAQTYELIGTTRDKNKLSSLEKEGITPIFLEPNFTVSQQTELANLFSKANILVSFPPDESSNRFFSSLCCQSKTIIYISSTSVYGHYTGTITEETPTDWQNAQSILRLEAEEYWLNQGAIVLRAPGLYGPKSGLHLRLNNGSYRLPPRADNYISRIHLQDMARIILAIFAKALTPGSIYLVGDLKPSTQLEIIEWLSHKMNLPLPAQAEPGELPTSPSSNRRIDPKKILDELKIELEYPTYKEGYTACLKQADFSDRFS